MSTSEKGKEIVEDSSSKDLDLEHFNLMVRKFNKFFRRKKKASQSVKRNNKKDEENVIQFTCFECGKQGHIKVDCLIYLKKSQEEKKGKK
uniref:CCHC-type domain-containing protein n=1 Tax=Cajanus cajan TaxID=3821 RepID=A0A151QYU3_CAJCA|nr:hypothetical protein KK1_043459 [Cajanus cajan]